MTKNYSKELPSPADTQCLIAKATALADRFGWRGAGSRNGVDDPAADAATVEEQIDELMRLTANLSAQLAITSSIEKARRMLSAEGLELPPDETPALKRTILSRQVCAFLFLAVIEGIEPTEVLKAAEGFYLEAEEEAGLQWVGRFG